MVTFDHRVRGTDETLWTADSRWLRVEALSEDFTQLIVVAAHPDDESLGAGGLIARSHARGAKVCVIIATDGEGSHPNSPTHAPSQLASIRRRELLCAVEILAPGASICFLGIPDGTIREHIDEVSRHVRAALSTFGVEGTLLVVPSGDDGHRDHVSVSRAAREVSAETGVRLREYPIWLWQWSNPDSLPWEAASQLPLSSAERALKQQALASHMSQSQALSDAPGDEALLSAETLEYFARDFETFFDPWHREGAPAAAPAGAPAVTRDLDLESQRESLGAPFFDAFYVGKSDPWGFESRWYEHRKRAITMAVLPEPRYQSALEIGCSTGVLTELLAARCDRLVAVDIAQHPLDVARERLSGVENVEFQRLQIPDEWPEGTFDLVVLSEVGYYLSLADLSLTLDRALNSMRPGGALVGCHWRHEVTEYPLTGDRVHRELNGVPGLERLVSHIEEDFILEVFATRPAQSVARRTGVI
jgi:LmbE family N-acetylglucosaminyl deacetylase/SAM-dependent methyltransferase